MAHPSPIPSFNQLADFHVLASLRRCRQLRVLKLNDNPVCEHPLYRTLCLALLPALTELDNEEVTPAEREAALTLVARNCHQPSRCWHQMQFLRSMRHPLSFRDPAGDWCSAVAPRAALVDGKSAQGLSVSHSYTLLPLFLVVFFVRVLSSPVLCEPPHVVLHTLADTWHMLSLQRRSARFTRDSLKRRFEHRRLMSQLSSASSSTPLVGLISFSPELLLS